MSLVHVKTEEPLLIRLLDLLVPDMLGPTMSPLLKTMELSVLFPPLLRHPARLAASLWTPTLATCPVTIAPY